MSLRSLGGDTLHDMGCEPEPQLLFPPRPPVLLLPQGLQGPGSLTGWLVSLSDTDTSGSWWNATPRSSLCQGTPCASVTRPAVPPRQQGSPSWPWARPLVHTGMCTWGHGRVPSSCPAVTLFPVLTLPGPLLGLASLRATDPFLSRGCLSQGSATQAMGPLRSLQSFQEFLCDGGTGCKGKAATVTSLVSQNRGCRAGDCWPGQRSAQGCGSGAVTHSSSV